MGEKRVFIFDSPAVRHSETSSRREELIFLIQHMGRVQSNLVCHSECMFSAAVQEMSLQGVAYQFGANMAYQFGANVQESEYPGFQLD